MNRIEAETYYKQIAEVVRFLHELTLPELTDLNIEVQHQIFVDRYKLKFNISQLAIDTWPNYRWDQLVYDEKFKQALEVLA